MGLEAGITREEFVTLQDNFFGNIDKRLTGGERIPLSVGANGDTIGYQFGFDHEEKSYSLRFDLTRKHDAKAEVLFIWHQVTKKFDDQLEFGRTSQALMRWWNSSHPRHIFRIYVDENERRIFVGRKFSPKQFREDTFRSLISRLIDVIPEVEARVEEGI